MSEQSLNHNSTKNGKIRKVIFVVIVLGLIILLFVMLDAYNGRQKESNVLPGQENNVINEAPKYKSGSQLVNVFFAKNGENEDCGQVYPLRRAVKDLSKLYEQTFRFLLAGPTPNEQKDGYFSFFTTKTANALLSVKVLDGVAYVNLKDISKDIPNASASCGSAQFMGEMETTLKQFPEIQKVIFAFDGDPEKFYEFIQMGCDDSNNNCDKTPFIEQ